MFNGILETISCRWGKVQIGQFGFLELNFKDNPKEMFKKVENKLPTAARLFLVERKALVYFAISHKKAGLY